ncbi:MAG: RHS repeat-associated core domain-containing protein [Clostridia bacterium]|nr:RHS repeat-associated core domain-containing protein [Clostridia bacterium]
MGNISKEYTLTASGIKTTRYEYDGNNCLLISYDDRSSTRYTYDKSGNLTNKIYELSGRETKSYYIYDGYNRLSEFVSGDTTAEYTYNPEGLRESKTVNGNYTRFIYDGENIVGELTGDNYYIYYRGTELISSKSYDNKGHFYRLDSHGNVTDLVNHLGESQKSYAYTPYGEEKLFGLNPSGEQTILYYWQKETDCTHNPFRYCGEYYDEESGLIYLRNRYYDPTSGRFITEDPARDGNNWYVYCGGNPVNSVDPEGTASFKEKWQAFWMVGPFDAVSINNIGNATLKEAQRYALEKGLTSVTDNIADAYRHFSWNYDAVKKGISAEDVMQATTNHEVLTQIYMGKDS